MSLQYVILKALPLVCMKYTARGESRVANIAKPSAIFVTRLSQEELYTFIQTKWQCFKCFCTLKDVLTEDTPLKFNTYIK